MARTRRALAAPSARGWRLSTASRTFRVLHRLTVILSLRRIRDPSARRHEVRILRLRSQARFAQDDTAQGLGVGVALSDALDVGAGVFVGGSGVGVGGSAGLATS